MTGRELRAQLRAQQGRNNPDEGRNFPVPGPVPTATGATPDESRELTALVAIIAADWPADEQAEALSGALAEPAEALRCFRALVAERADGTRTRTGAREAHDGLRACQQCANLSGAGRCLAAWRGELAGFPRTYSPATPGQAQRCAGYAPGPDDPDRRTGRDRWPFLDDGATP